MQGGAAGAGEGGDRGRRRRGPAVPPGEAGRPRGAGPPRERRRAARRREQYVAEARAARLEGLKREIRGKAVDWWSAHKKAAAAADWS